MLPMSVRVHPLIKSEDIGFSDRLPAEKLTFLY